MSKHLSATTVSNPSLCFLKRSAPSRPTPASALCQAVQDDTVPRAGNGGPWSQLYSSMFIGRKIETQFRGYITASEGAGSFSPQIQVVQKLFLGKAPDVAIEHKRVGLTAVVESNPLPDLGKRCRLLLQGMAQYPCKNSDRCRLRSEILRYCRLHRSGWPCGAVANYSHTWPLSAFDLTRSIPARRIPKRIAIIAITARSSIRVNPRLVFWFP